MHLLQVVTWKTDFLVVFPGERYDFYIETTDPLELGSYWMRFETLEYYDSNFTRIHAHHVEAIVRYDYTCQDSNCEIRPQGAPEVPQSERITCENPKSGSACSMLNCPFR